MDTGQPAGSAGTNREGRRIGEGRGSEERRREERGEGERGRRRRGGGTKERQMKENFSLMSSAPPASLC